MVYSDFPLKHESLSVRNDGILIVNLVIIFLSKLIKDMMKKKNGPYRYEYISLSHQTKFDLYTFQSGIK